MFNTPFTQPQQFFAAWQSFMTGQSDRVDALTSQMQEAEQAAMTRANEAIDEYAKLMKASLRYQQQLTQAWRDQVLAATQTMSQMADNPVAAPATSPKATSES